MGTMKVNGVDLQVSRFGRDPGGDRPVVVGIHGLGMADSSGLALTLGLPLASSFEVVLYDLRGHGRSQVVASGYTVAEHVDDLVAVLDVLGVGRPVHLVAGGHGGHVGVVAAARHGRRVASLSLLDPRFPLQGWGADLARALEWCADQLAGAGGSPAAVLPPTPRRRAAMTGRGHRLLRATTFIDDVRREPPLAAREFARIACPVLAVFGTDAGDYVLARLLRDLVGRVEVATVPGVDHLRTFDRARTRAVVADFVRRAEATRR